MPDDLDKMFAELKHEGKTPEFLEGVLFGMQILADEITKGHKQTEPRRSAVIAKSRKLSAETEMLIKRADEILNPQPR